MSAERTSAGSGRGDGPTNRITPQRSERADLPASRSLARGDVPEAILDRYLIERDRKGRPERFFRDHRSEDPHFQDRGRALVAAHAYPDAVVDMLKIARHRNWSQVRVAGDDAFKREVWIQAQALGLEVKGYRPRERDREAAGLPPQDRREVGRQRLDQAAAIVRGLIPDAEVQARLLAHAWSRLREGEQRRDLDTRRDRARER
ncbi:LPD7 domain-containing protein [Brevundimonas nasdae]|uniref:Large polyvalent protein-associated domain-containing protein n=1 Tax=Brevundimonas nasdae TaxID=172043 RepID=A0ABX8TKD1_9CAUL|nr:LPD7 domain-containing protein [Brevundimonas nasdae]QYC11464.1 hypothetical protein KWG56_05675 [Brevundimonas nasdae]QYC14252.1 hypothetical protein KWG63_01010 [Brevundimonas nasdae]